MKKLYFSISFIALNLAFSYAQIIGPMEGRIYASGSVGLKSSSTAATNGSPQINTATATFSPSVGYFIKKNMAVGGRLNISREKITNYNEGHSLGIEAFYRYYETMDFAEGKIAVFGEASMGYSKSNDSYLAFGGTKTETSKFEFNIAPGVGFYLTKVFGIEFTFPTVLGISSSTPKVSGKISPSTTSYEVGFSSLSGSKITLLFFLL